MIQKFDSKLEHLTNLVLKLIQNPPQPEVRVARNLHPPQFLRLKEVMARVGLRPSSLYHHISLGTFPRPRKFGRSSLWVTAEVDDWIAKRTAGVRIEINGGGANHEHKGQGGPKVQTADGTTVER